MKAILHNPGLDLIFLALAFHQCVKGFGRERRIDVACNVVLVCAWVLAFAEDIGLIGAGA